MIIDVIFVTVALLCLVLLWRATGDKNKTQSSETFVEIISILPPEQQAEIIAEMISTGNPEQQAAALSWLAKNRRQQQDSSDD